MEDSIVANTQKALNTRLQKLQMRLSHTVIDIYMSVTRIMTYTESFIMIVVLVVKKSFTLC